MVWRPHLLVVLIVVSSIFAFATPASADSRGCAPIQVLSGSCPVSASNNGRTVTLERGWTKPGRSGSSGGGGSAGSGSGSGAGGGAGASDPDGPAIVRDNYTATMPVRPVTLSDVAKFRPNPGVDLMQPDGWMIVGLSTNFYAHAARHIKAGTLLGQPAYVRFTPVRYSWTYGDGAGRTASTPGATWAAQGIHEFDATPTSHIYRAPGRYFIDLTIGFAPEYRLAVSTDWVPVNGLVWVPANRLVAVAAAGAKTVLVEDECTTNPAGPGC